jgi:hypothetical protein
VLLQIDRIVSEYKHARKDPEYLVKWRGLEYAECTWESEEEICRDGQGKVRHLAYSCNQKCSQNASVFP